MRASLCGDVWQHEPLFCFYVGMQAYGRYLIVDISLNCLQQQLLGETGGKQ